jgi:hypothetical protein
MNKLPIICALAAAAAFPQAQTPLTITQSAGSATGELRLQERRTNGTNYVGIKAPQSVASSTVWTLPSADGTAGQVLSTNGGQVLSWTSVSGNTIPVCASTTGNDLYTCTVASFTAYSANYCIILSVDFANVGTATVDISGGGAKSILRYGGSALVTNDILVNSPTMICYDGTQFTLPASASLGSGAFLNGGNTFGAAATLGTNDAQTLSLETNGTGRWSILTTGDLYAGANNTYDIGAGLSANSPRSVYAATSMVTPKIGRDSSASLTIMTDSADRWIYTSAGMITPAATDAYDIGNLTTPLRVRGLYSKIVDTALAGGTGDYLQTRKIQLFDNTGSSTGASYWDLNVVMSGVGAFQNSYFYLRDNGGNTVWRADRIASGSLVATTTIYTDLLPDSTANTRDLGKTTQRWDEINGASLDLSGAANITGNLSAAVINATGSPAYRVAGTTVINASREATFAGLTIATGAASGYVWTSDGSGVGSWQAASGAALPVVDTNGIAKGSSDATKIVRFEVDGFTTGNTRTLTPQNNSYTLAGTDISQTFSNTQTFSGTLAVSGTVGDDFIPSSDGTFTNGTTFFRWGSIATYDADFNGVLTFSGGTTFTGSFIPTTNNTDAIGNTSYRVSDVATVNADISGTITTPSGSAGITSTKTVWDSAGTGNCTLIFSGGILTGGTC